MVGLFSDVTQLLVRSSRMDHGGGSDVPRPDVGGFPANLSPLTFAFSFILKTHPDFPLHSVLKNGGKRSSEGRVWERKRPFRGGMGTISQFRNCTLASTEFMQRDASWEAAPRHLDRLLDGGHVDSGPRPLHGGILHWFAAGPLSNKTRQMGFARL